MNAQFVFQGDALHAVAHTRLALGIEQELGHHEQRNAFDARRRIRQACQDQMHDVVGHLVIAPGDENLLPGDQVVVALGHGAALDGRQIGAGIRLGQVHRPGPLAAHQFFQVGALQFGRAVMGDGFDGALGQHGAQGERHIG